MKRVLTVVLMLAFVLSLACPVFAAENVFVPSISEKGAPKFLVDANGHIGTILDAEGNVLDHLAEDCLLITSVAEVADSELIPADAAALLLDVYAKLLSGEMVLPVEKLGANLEADEIVIRDLVDMSWLCTDHPELVAPDGIVFQVTLDLGVAATDEVHVLTYKNNEWNPVVDVVNNGDGTVTCTFENLCPVAFAIGDDQDSPSTGEFNPKIMVWMGVLTASAAAVAVMFASRRKENRA